jgi:CheY-like chemotaxis protein
LLGGELQVRSNPGEGSTFTLFVPLQAASVATGATLGTPARYDNSGAMVPTALPANLEISDDRDALGSDPFVLIVEDDATFASILLDLAREAGLKGVVSTAGAGTLAMARKLQPDAITLDLGLSDIDGFVLLDLLKHDPQTRDVPIHVISGAEQAKSVIGMGAFGITEKPASHDALTRVFADIQKHVSRSERRLLIVGDAAARKAAADAIQDPAIEVETALSIGRLKRGLDDFDIVLLAYADSVHAARELKKLGTAETAATVLILSKTGEEAELAAAVSELGGAHDIVVLSGLEELLPRLAYATSRGKRPAKGIESITAPRGVPELAGAKILIVDDDIRNIFSLTSVLESYDVEVLHAERGRDGILILEQTPGVDIALIDIMMPEMDGYETMQQIRKRPALAEVPLIAVTAKAMKGDRQKCLDAGASDYIAKPVDIELLLALLRVWIGRARGGSTGVPAKAIAAQAAE